MDSTSDEAIWERVVAGDPAPSASSGIDIPAFESDGVTKIGVFRVGGP